jgi:hypothetical protein
MLLTEILDEEFPKTFPPLLLLKFDEVLAIVEVVFAIYIFYF